MALAYRSHLMDRDLAAITINRRLTALRSMIKLGRTLGLVPWTLATVPKSSATPGAGASHCERRGPLDQVLLNFSTLTSV
jgi:hypothetical protein